MQEISCCWKHKKPSKYPRFSGEPRKQLGICATEEMEIAVVTSKSDSWKYPKPGTNTFSVCPRNTEKAGPFLIFMRKMCHILPWSI